MPDSVYHNIVKGHIPTIARSISWIENEVPGYIELLRALPESDTPVIGITGSPGAGKSTLTNALLKELLASGKKIAILCVDPSSPFNRGALLGDRIRMSEWYNHPDVYIRSLASRGALGGLSPKIIEITDLVKAAGFDMVIVETVGIGQSEIEIAGLADTTILVVVPEGGDEVQTMKAGVMEIADIFVVNKSDRPGAESFVKNLQLMLAPAFSNHIGEVAIVKTVASENKGITELVEKITEHHSILKSNDQKNWLLAEKAWQLVRQKRMKDITKQLLKEKIAAARKAGPFNLYAFVSEQEI